MFPMAFWLDTDDSGDVTQIRLVSQSLRGGNPAILPMYYGLDDQDSAWRRLLEEARAWARVNRNDDAAVVQVNGVPLWCDVLDGDHDRWALVVMAGSEVQGFVYQHQGKRL